MILASASLRARIAPAWGGGVVRLDALTPQGAVPLLRACEFEPGPAPSAPGPDPNTLACYPLVPWSNRISADGFEFDGRRIELPRNRDDEPWPIHGSGWQRPWRVAHADAGEAILVLDEDDASQAYRYRAELHYRLREDRFEARLSVVNTGPAAMPFGLGLHPFFVRDADTRLRAPARQVWLNDGRTPLPTQLAAIPEPWRFVEERALPRDCIDHAFVGWPGEASVHWPRRRLRLDLAADASNFVLFTPQDANFFCFEPVDHAIDAVHLPGGAAAHGMTVLAPGEGMQRRYRFTVRADG
jgi:aldose 1-epimerase